MPSHKPVKSLQSLSLSTIIKFCNKDQNTFAKIPNRILVEIVNHEEYKKYLTERQLKMATKQYTDNLEMVIHQFTDRLNFSKSPICIIRRGVELICKLRPKLTHLDLSHTSIKVKNLKKLVKSIPNIQSLQLNSTRTTDEVLSILAQNCPDLRELDISDSNITDYGIRALCKNGHRLIRKLEVFGTSITDQGALMAMRNFPHLRHFDYIHILRILETIYNQYDDGSHQPKIKFQLGIIQHHNLLDDLTISSSLDIASVLCPNITHLLISGIKNTDTWLIKLAKFPKLTDLVLMGLISDELTTYSIIIAPLLKTIGNNLTRFILYGIEDVDLWDIGRNCTQLTSLNLAVHFVSLIPLTVDYFPRDIFCKLREFDIFDVGENGISIDQLECVLSNCHETEHLFIWHCRSLSLTDDVLNRVLERNSFSKLCHFGIKHCDNIGISSILSLVRSCKLLQVLDYRECANIGAADNQQLQDLVQKENLNLSILFADV